MGERINKITIVSGGTAGWLTASFLTRALNWRSEGPPVEIQVIESPAIPSVGVGESTLPAMPQMLGINESEFIRHCNVSFKCGVNFVNWDVDAEGKPRTYVNPFIPLDDINGYHPAFYFNRFGPIDSRPSLSDATLLIDARRGPRMPDTPDWHHTDPQSPRIPEGAMLYGQA